MTRKVEVERFSLTSSQSFDDVLAAINDAVREFRRAPGAQNLDKKVEVFCDRLLEPTKLEARECQNWMER